MASKKCVVFDCDGVLLDSVNPTFEVTKKFFAHKGKLCPMKTLEEFKYRMNHDTYDNILEEAGYIAEENGFIKSNFIGSVMPNSSIFAGVEAVLSNLYFRKLILNVVSKNHKEILEHHLSPVRHYFTKIVSDSRKPDPKDLLGVIKCSGVQKCDAVYVGDMRMDAKMAENAGVDFIGVLWGFGTEETLRDCKSIALVKTLEELEQVLAVY